MEPEDFSFYEKIKVPPPTFCRECRLIRRLAWMKGFRLYKRQCGLCKKETISMYPASAPYTVYCVHCWWSDNWDPEEYAQEYDFSRPFFEQMNEFLHRIPIMAQAISKACSTESPYTNHCDHAKNCYLIFYSDYCEDTQYGFYITRDKSLLDSSVVFECEECYDSIHGFRNHRVHGSQGNVTNSIDCYFLKDSKNATDCFGSANLRNAEYVFLGEQLTKDAYETRMKEIDLGSYKTYQEMKLRAQDLWKKSAPQPYYNEFSHNSSGNYVFESRNCKECYDAVSCEDCKYVMLIKKGKVKDCYDYTDWGENAERIYDSITVGNGVADVCFSQDVHGSHNVEYSKSCMGSAYLFGCSGLRTKEYYIFNKKYSKEDFEKMRARIINHMNEMPYISGKSEARNSKSETQGIVYRYGEFFPMEFSPHDYNDTFAHMFRPLLRAEVEAKNLGWADDTGVAYQITKDNKELPDNIKDVDDSVLKEVIQCATCSRGYRITPQELQFLRHHHFPLPRRCPFCRIEEKVKQWVSQMTLGDRDCDKCGTTFKTNYYRKEDAPILYCKECYIREVV